MDRRTFGITVTVSAGSFLLGLIWAQSGPDFKVAGRIVFAATAEPEPIELGSLPVALDPQMMDRDRMTLTSAGMLFFKPLLAVEPMSNNVAREILDNLLELAERRLMEIKAKG